MREKGSWSDATYTSRATEAKVRGSSTYEGEERARQGKALDPLVDPSKYTDQNKRGSNTLLVPEGDEFVAPYGVAIPVQPDLDTTGSMGGNVDIAFKVLPKVQNLLIQGENAVLKRYHTQIATGIVQDRSDRYPYLRTMFEPDNEVERQMGLLVPERSGGDATEDYQLGLFMATYLTKASITNYGLKGYYFVVGDEKGRDRFDVRVLEQVFGPDVLERAFGSRPSQTLPSTEEVAQELMKNWHAFYLQVNQNREANSWWTNLLGRERVIQLSRTEDLAEVQAVIIGLTEGVLDLQNIADFIGDTGKSLDRRAKLSKITLAVGNIPIGLQASYSNFNKIPLAGARFKNRDDVWPIGTSIPNKEKTRLSEVGKKNDKKGKDWKI